MGKGAQHLEQDSKFAEPPPPALQVLDGPQRSRDGPGPLCQGQGQPET